MKLTLETEKEISHTELKKCYHRVFDSKDGQTILQDLANSSGAFRTNFVQGDSHHTAFLEGHRALFFYICSQLEERAGNIKGNKQSTEEWNI